MGFRLLGFGLRVQEREFRASESVRRGDAASDGSREKSEKLCPHLQEIYKGTIGLVFYIRVLFVRVLYYNWDPERGPN